MGVLYLLTRLPHMKCARLSSVRLSLPICRVNSNTLKRALNFTTNPLNEMKAG